MICLTSFAEGWGKKIDFDKVMLLNQNTNQITIPIYLSNLNFKNSAGYEVGPDVR